MNKPLMEPLYEAIICPWTAENPRHDHQLIFPLSDRRLLLVWSEYYADRPSVAERTPHTKEGSTSDEFPCRISGKISIDEGRSWGERFILQENLWGRNVKHPNMLHLDSGEILFTFTAWESESERNIFMKRSVDECETWRTIEQISESGWYCTNNDHIARLASGRILLPAHGGPGFKFVKGNPLHSFVIISDDGFKTWRLSADTMTAPGRGAHEPSIVELRDGRLLCLLRTTQGCIYKSHSEDGGEHWAEPVPTQLEAPDSPPLVRRIPPTGDLLLLWNNVYSNSNWPRTPLTAAVSRDEGETWGFFRDVDRRSDHDAAYASVYFRENEVLVVYYTRDRSWARDSELMLKVFTIDAFYN